MSDDAVGRIEALADEWERVRDGVLSPGLRKAASELRAVGLAIKADNEAVDRQDYRAWLARGESPTPTEQEKP